MFFAAILLICSCAPVDASSQLDAPVIAPAEKPFDARELPSAPEAKAAEAPPPAEPIVPRSTPIPAGRGLFLASYETPKHRKAWFALSVAGHTGAAFDAWSTRRAVAHGYTESNPMLRPFAGSNTLYAATQLTPLVMDYVGHRMMFNKRNWVRRIWWVPQAAGAGFSFGAGIHNVSVVH